LGSKWTFRKQGICAKYIVSTYGSKVLYANSNNLLVSWSSLITTQHNENVSKGAVIYATSVYTIFTVELTSDGNYK